MNTINGVPLLELNSGFAIPQLGYGTWNSHPDQVTEAVLNAIDIGYRHFDCAMVYENESYVGNALRQRLQNGRLQRNELFVTSKLWNTFHIPHLVQDACKQSLADLGLDYLDLYLIQWPVAYQEGDDLFPQKPDGTAIPSDADYVHTWHAMEELKSQGLVRSIGVSNFNKRQIERIIDEGTIVPAVNQVECHAYLTQHKLSEFCASKGILVTAYSPLGSPDRSKVEENHPVLLEDIILKAIGDKYGKTPAQVLIRYQIQRGHAVIPKSVTRSRIEENFNVFDFELSTSDMAEVGRMDRNLRFFVQSSSLGHKHHPFENDEY